MSKCTVLKGRSVILYPDSGQYEKWVSKAKELSKTCGASISVSDFIEQHAKGEKEKVGFDLADLLVQYKPDYFFSFKNPVLLSLQQQANVLRELDEVGCEEFNALDTQKTAMTKQHPAYVSDDGTLYIPTLPNGRTTYTVYQSVNEYNNRLKLPHMMPYENVCTSGMKQVALNLETLKIGL